MNKQKRKCLIHGYIRRIQNLCVTKQTIPTVINILVLSFHGKRYKVYGIGRNKYGDFALNHLHKITKKWAHLGDFDNLICSLDDVYRGHGRFLIKTEYHRVFCVGKNDRGELGLSSNKDFILHFKQLKKLENVKYNINYNYISIISNGFMAKHSLLITNNGDIYGMGNNHYAQYGNGDKTNNKLFCPIQLDQTEEIFDDINIIKIECGTLHTLFLTSSHHIYSAGFNGLGQLGVSKSTNTWDDYQLIPIQIPSLSDIIDIKCGADHNLALMKNGKQTNLIVFGSNDRSQFGLRTFPNTNKVDDMDVNIIVNDDNDNDLNVFDDYSADAYDDILQTKKIAKFIDIPIIHPFFQNKDIDSICCGGWNSSVILCNGSLYTFGYNIWKQSIGEEIQISYPQLLQSFDKYSNLKIKNIDLGMSHSLIITNENELYSVGNNLYSQCTNKSKKEYVVFPYWVKKTDIGIKKGDKIERVLAGDLSSVIFTS